MLNDLHALDTETFVWTSVLAAETPPSPRAGHTMNVVGDLVMLFGGGDGEKVLNDLHFLESTPMGPTLYRWLHPPTVATAPTGRCAHTATAGAEESAPTERTTTVYVFGGGDGNRRFKDVYLLNPAQVFRGKSTATTTTTAATATAAATTAEKSQPQSQS
jgi:hypothetical protein